MNDCIIEIENATVIRRRRIILRNVNLCIRRGESVGVLGPNGAGKTTLLMLLNGLVRANSGYVKVLGKTISNNQGDVRKKTWPLMNFDGSLSRLRTRIGYVAQVRHCDARLPMTVRESVMMGAWGRIGWLRNPSAQEHQKVNDALERVGISHLADRPLGHLSGGEWQRAAIARVLVQEPDLFLYDEPTASIDPRAQRDIMRQIEHLHQSMKTTMLYVTHDLAALPTVCNRLILLKDGTVWRDGPREECLQPEWLHELYAAEECDIEDKQSSRSSGDNICLRTETD